MKDMRNAEAGASPASALPFAGDPAGRLSEAARALGVSWVGIARAQPLAEEEARLRAWLEAGHHAGMAWLAADPALRADPTRLLPGCRSVVVLGLNYLREDGDPAPEGPVGLVARYARNRDYHRVLGKIGQRLARRLREEWAPGCDARPFVDVGPVLERAWAVRAGLGFIGKNSMLIHPREGSYFVLSTILTTADLPPTPPLADIANGCGGCRRCLDDCPTGAIVEAGVVDSRRCLSYLTIETAGDAIAEPLAARMDGWVFGCDVCQDVCPYNRVRASPAPESSPLGEAVVPGAWPLVELLGITDEWIDRIPVGTPIRRAGADNLARNAALVAAERGGAAEYWALRRIQAAARRAPWLRAVARRCADRLRARVSSPSAGRTR
jgi:epoxyqueuosine reductase